jgi:hypothetical protein
LSALLYVQRNFTRSYPSERNEAWEGLQDQCSGQHTQKRSLIALRSVWRETKKWVERARP